jgi:hypothetical protein
LADELVRPLWLISFKTGSGKVISKLFIFLGDWHLPPKSCTSCPRPLGGVLQILGDFCWTLSIKINTRLGELDNKVDE